MKKHSMAFTLVLTVLASMAVGQSPGKPEPPPAVDPVPDRPEPRRLIERIKIWTLIEELDLTEEQIARFIPKYKDQQKEEQIFFESRMKRISELANLVQNEKVSDDKIKAKVEEIEKLQNDYQKKSEALKQEILTLLTIRQRAKMILFLEAFEKKLRRIIEEIRNRPGGQPPHPPKEKIGEE